MSEALSVDRLGSVDFATDGFITTQAYNNSYILNIIDHYLRNRNVYIEMGENRSESFKPEVGLGWL